MHKTQEEFDAQFPAKVVEESDRELDLLRRQMLSDRIVAEVLRRLAETLDRHYTPGYYGHGGPQDGEDEPPSMDFKAVIRELYEQVDGLEGREEDGLETKKPH